MELAHPSPAGRCCQRPAGPFRRSASRLVKPLRDPSFRRLALGRGASYLGDWILAAALVGWLYRDSHSLVEVSALLLVRLLPPVLAGGLAGALVDRLPKERVLVAAEATTGIAIAAAFLGVHIGSPAVILAAGAVWGFLATVVSVSVNALVPAVVDAEQLGEANAVVGVTQETAMAAGALGAGVLLATIGAEAAVLLAGVAYAAAVLTHRGVRTSSLPRSAPAAARPRAVAELRAAVRYFRGRPVIVAIASSFALATLATGLTNASLPRFTASIGLGAGGYGLALGVLAIGLALGEAMTGGVAQRMNVAWLGWSLTAMAALFVALSHAGGAVTALLLFAAIGVADGVSEVVMTTLLQRESDPAYHGRVFGLTATLFRTTMMAAVAAAPLANRLAAPSTAIELGAGFLVLAAIVALRGTRERGPAPIPESVPA